MVASNNLFASPFVPSARPVHLVKNFDEVPAKKRTYPLVAQEKHDGCYGFAVVAQNDYRIFSRTGKSEFKALAHLRKELACMHIDSGTLADVVLIFEVMALNMSAAAIAGRCQDETNLFPEAYAVVHDAIPLEDFKNGYSAVPYQDRYKVACKIAERLEWAHTGCELVHTEQAARDFAQVIIDRGGEGAVFKQQWGTWTAGKKNEVMMKIKQELSYDLTIVGMVEGEGKYKGMLGTLTFTWRRFGKPDGEPCYVNASGMSDNDRMCWWANPSLVMHRIGQVDAMRFTEFGMLREPRFKGIRFDKEQADIA